MKKTIIYSTPIWSYQIDNFELSKDKFISSCKEYKNSNQKLNTKDSSTVNGYQTSDELHTKEDLSNIFETICMIAYNAGKDLNFSEFEIGIRSSWVNFNSSRSEFNHPHSHTGIFSGVVYLNSPENSGNLCIINPGYNPLWEGNFLVKENYKGEHTSECLKISPEEGMVYIWPSYLMHYVEPNNHDGERISISFKIEMNPIEVGSDE